MKLIPLLAGAAVALPCLPQDADACRRHDRVKVRPACHAVRPACHASTVYRTGHYRAPVRHRSHYYHSGYGYRPGRPFLAGALTGAALTAAFVDDDRRYYRHRYHRNYYGRGYYRPGYHRSGFYGPRASIGFGFGPGYWW